MRGKGDVIGGYMDHCQLHKGPVNQMLVQVTHNYDVLPVVGGSDGVELVGEEF